MASIPIQGIPSSFSVPGTYAEIVFAQGASVADAGTRSAIYVMPKSLSGEWTANTVYRVKNENEAADGAGVGSPLHQALAVALKANRTGRVYALPFAASSGAGAVAADGYLGIVGTAVTSGTISATINGVTVDASVSVGDTADTIGALLEELINAKRSLPCTASNTSGKVTLTAKIPGASQNGIIQIRISKSKAGGITVNSTGTTLGVGTYATEGTDGAVTETANLAAALAVIDASRYYYIVISESDATSLGSLQTHIAAKSEPINGLRSVGISATVGTVAASQALAIARNYERLQLVWQPNSEWTPAQLAGNVAAVRQKYEQLDSAYNFDSYSNSSDWFVPAVYAESDRPDTSDQNDAIMDGVTPIASRESGSYLVTSVTTRSKNAAGTVDDSRVRDTHRVSVCDEVTDTWLTRHSNTYGGFKLKDDEYLSNGDVNPNAKKIVRVLTPSQYKPFVSNILREYEGAGKLKNVTAAIEGLQVVIDPNNPSRIECGVSLETIDLLHSTTIRVAESSAG